MITPNIYGESLTVLYN